MSDGYDRLQAAGEDLRLLVSDLSQLSGELEELATVGRRVGLEHPPGFQRRIRDSAARLVATLEALVAAGTGQQPGLAFSAVAQLCALESDIAAVVPPADGSGYGGERLRVTLTATLQRVRRRLWSLISHLVKIKELSFNGLASPGATGTTPESILVTFG